MDLFTHHGKRLIGLTEPGQEIAVLVARVIQDVQRIEEVADSHVNAERGGLVVVATRHAASTRLRDTMMRFCEAMPALNVRVFEEEPRSASAMLRAGDADIGILSEPSEHDPELLYFPIETWRLLLVVPKDRPLNDRTEISLEILARYQICSYERTAHSRRIVEDAFRAVGMEAPIAHALGSCAMIANALSA
nr:LysR substrate-binding domain-containing protein [Thiocapsa sp.]